jgi:hypothetical protein
MDSQTSLLSDLTMLLPFKKRVIWWEMMKNIKNIEWNKVMDICWERKEVKNQNDFHFW